MSVAIRGYYDKSGNRNDERITLAGYAASPSVWSRFEERWIRVLQNAPVQPCSYLHMVEARSLTKGFDKSLGWTHPKVDELIRNLINECFATEGWSKGEDRIVAAYCTIEAADYEKACKEIPHLKEKASPIDICAEYVTRVALGLLPQNPDKPRGYRKGTVEMFFDRNEPFKAKVERAWNKAKKNKKGPLGLISAIGESDMRETPGLQAADYLAWHVNRWYTKGCVNSNLMAVLTTQGLGNRFDYKMLLEWYGDEANPKPFSGSY